ncbi:MAG TPA: MBL fold metallo-hydrolase [Planctomycetota bacterium]|nr:MBL fold metallo-hydrolase [Planctomycetota bacterium]
MSRRIAAALLLTRGGGQSLEVFLVERSPELRFFGGYWAMPGGTLAPEDGDPARDEAAALQACAHRELFEETGLLRHVLPAERRTAAQLRGARHALLQREQQGNGGRPSPWLALIAGAPVPPPLLQFCRIETPPFVPVRYDTAFCHVPLASCTAGTDELLPNVWPGELRGGRFFRPAEALAAWTRGELLLVPPVILLLELLAAAADLPAFFAAASSLAADYRQGRLHQVRFSPGVVLAPLRSPTLPPATTTNCYVVGQQQLWVVDPGSPHHDEQQRLTALLRELCSQQHATVQGILATHHHPDHIGGAAALSQELDLPVRGHPLTLSRLPDGCRLGAPLDDGAKVPLGQAPDGTADWKLLAIHTPGHDRGHLCFRESRYGAVLVGDMLSTMSTIIVDPPEGHLATYLQSLERLLAEPLTTLYPAHGPAQRFGHKLVKQYLRHRRQRETKLLECLQGGGGTLEQLVPKVYWDADPKLYPFAARSLLAGLQKLQEERRAVEDDGHWRAGAARRSQDR